MKIRPIPRDLNPHTFAAIARPFDLLLGVLLVASTATQPARAAENAAKPNAPAPHGETARGPRGGILVGDQVSRAEVLIEPARPKVEIYLMRDRAYAGTEHPDAIGLTYTNREGRQITVELTAIEPTPEFIRYLGPSPVQVGSYAGLEVRIPLSSGRKKKPDARVLRPVKPEGHSR
jgi:hypothetical protein